VRLPSRVFIIVTAIVIALVALVANGIALLVEPPGAGLTATNGPPLPVPPRSLTPSGEHTRSFDVDTRIRADGSARISETIVQDFGFLARHGIERVIPVRDGTREYRMSDVVVSTSDGTPDDVQILNSPDTVTIRIGDADRTISGVHAYRVNYDLDGLTEAAKQSDHTALAVDAISAWRQSIEELTYTVVSPGAPTTFRCQQGSLGSTAGCASAERTPSGATFRGENLAFRDAFTVRMTWPTSVVAISEQSSVVGNADLLYAVLVGLMLLFVGWRYRRKWVRLLATAQSQLWATFGPDIGGQQLQSYDLRGDPAIEFTPPLGLRPGEVGALLEVAPTAMLTATVVDLAARGAIRISETGGTWTLERRNRDVALTDDEQIVVERLFGGADTTTLDDRGAEMSTLAGELAELQTDDLEDRELAVRGITAGNLRGKTHVAWLAVVGLIAVVVGAVTHGIVVTVSGNRTAAIVIEVLLVALIILGIGAIVVGGAARGLTPKGIAAAWRVRGFDRFFTASEALHARAAADKGLFRQYMGYAVVLGHVDRWVAAFDAPDTSDWFATSHPTNMAFALFAASSIWSPPASSGSSSSGFGGGFSGAGGGGGGGGGGSW
jgi:hypothetical protein